MFRNGTYERYVGRYSQETGQCFDRQASKAYLGLIRTYSYTHTHTHITSLKTTTQVRLGKDLGIAHNDPNVTRNLMTNTKGEFMLIDFGFAKTKKTKSVGLNGGLVARVMDRLKNGSKGKKILSDWIRKTEKSENRVVDVRGKVKRDLRRRKLERLAKVVGWDRAVEMMGGDVEQEDGVEVKKKEEKKKKKSPAVVKKKMKKRKTSPVTKGKAAVLKKRKGSGRGSAKVLKKKKKENVIVVEEEEEEEEDSMKENSKSRRLKHHLPLLAAATGVVVMALVAMKQ